MISPAFWYMERFTQWVKTQNWIQRSEKWILLSDTQSFIRRKHLRVEASWKMTHRSILILTLPLGSHVMRLLQVTNWSGPFTRLLVSSSITMLCSTSEKRGSFCLIHSECSWLDSQLINLFMPHYSWADRLATKSYIMFWPRSLVIPWYHHW